MDTAMADGKPPNVDPAIFQRLQEKIDEEGKVREELKETVQTLEKQGRLTQSILSRIHNTPTPELASTVLNPAADAIKEQASTVSILSTTASKQPFYKYSVIWSHALQALLTSIQLQHWLATNNLITLEATGTLLNVPVNLKTADSFHLPIEDYLLALTSTIDELARLAPNSVTLGDNARPLQISRFVKDVHAGFQLLNLKNDALRRKVDGIKYSVKRVEDVVYDLSLRGLLPKEG